MLSANDHSFRLETFGWKSYNTIKKKAMEREFSWSGLLISLSVAFFIVIGAAQGLKLVYQSMSMTAGTSSQIENKL